MFQAYLGNRLQCSPFYNSMIGAHRNSCVISKFCYKGTILQRNYRKMTISWPFSYNSFVKFYGKTNWEPLHDQDVSKPVLFCLFDLILYIPINSLPFMSGRVFLG